MRHTNDTALTWILIVLALSFTGSVALAVYFQYSGTAIFKGGGFEIYLNGNPPSK